MMHAQLLDTRQDLAVSLKREAGLSADLRRAQQVDICVYMIYGIRNVYFIALYDIYNVYM